MPTARPRQTTDANTLEFGLGSVYVCEQPRKEPLEILALGLSRTGTSSLFVALKTLGYGIPHSSRAIVSNNQEALAASAISAKYENKGKKWGFEQFESIFADYRAVTGEFASCFAEELLALYPEAKVILTVRDSEDEWLESVKATMWYGSHHPINSFLKRTDPITKKMRVFTTTLWRCMYAGSLPEHGIRVYREHNAMVKRLCADTPGRLLVLDAKDGWEPLCEFLGKPVPDEPYPHMLIREQHRAVFRESRRQGVIRVLKRAVVNIVVPMGVVAFVALQWGRIRSWVRHTI